MESPYFGLGHQLERRDYLDLALLAFTHLGPGEALERLEPIAALEGPLRELAARLLVTARERSAAGRDDSSGPPE